MNIFNALFLNLNFFNWLYLYQRNTDQGFLREAPGIKLVLVYKQGVLVKDYPSGQQVLLSLNLFTQLTLVNDVIWHNLLEIDSLEAGL